MIHGVDSEKLLAEIDKRAKTAGRMVDVLLQVHIAREETKHGFSPEELRETMNAWVPGRWPNVRVRGLMGMATNTEDNAVISVEFRGLAALFSEIQAGGGLGPGFDQLSMGMTSDYGLALAEGSTMVRIGTAIFGERV
jgi:pyridoxal phosphate enzyme (YggS family)